MKNITNILLTLIFLISVTTITAQSDCILVCHNGKVVKTFQANSWGGHQAHGDIFISDDCEANADLIGTDCSTLSVKTFTIKEALPEGLKYYISDIQGRIYRVGVTDGTPFKNLPKRGVYFINVEGYKTKKYIKLN